jgi:flagellar basal-body rod protein FlgC
MATLFGAVSASATALNAERTRIEVAVSNVANAESTRGPDGQPYRRRDVVLSPAPENTFDAALGQASAVGVEVAGVIEDTAEFRRRYDPSHPDADKGGFVAMPNVDVPEQMVDMVSASRAYQANLAAIGIVNDLMRKALELGR